MSHDDELRQFRAVLDDLSRRVGAAEAPDVSGGKSVAVVTVSAGSYPTSGAVGKVFAVQAVDVTGADAEGAAATFTPVGGVFFAANLLGGLPPVGTKLAAKSVPINAWVIEYA